MYSTITNILPTTLPAPSNLGGHFLSLVYSYSTFVIILFHFVFVTNLCIGIPQFRTYYGLRKTEKTGWEIGGLGRKVQKGGKAKLTRRQPKILGLVFGLCGCIMKIGFFRTTQNKYPWEDFCLQVYCLGRLFDC